MKIAALVDDMFFASKISATARQTGCELVFCRNTESVPPDTNRILVDLNSTTFDPVREIQKLKARGGAAGAPIIAYLSHVQVELQQMAQQAGADEVISRSAFVQRLPEILGSQEPEGRSQE